MIAEQLVSVSVGDNTWTNLLPKTKRQRAGARKLSEPTDRPES